ncbi:MAG: UDP-N-acetylmuramate--L-alanine ligase, partial [Gammaproteobacteria bacterium]|nr:UDP-N-acetylmuramate--L-alanine ligase [Gammaproteobacteria bacterium]
MKSLQGPMRRVKTIHMIGIGGAGMSAIAEVLLSHGFEVHGSDLSRSVITERLTKQGARVAIGHDRDNLANADVVVVSSAVPEENPEIIAARKRRIP